MSNDAEKKELIDMINRHADQMGEHVDTVQVFATMRAVDGSGNTITFNTGRGNWYARYGQVEEWIRMEHERHRLEVERIDAEEHEE